MGVIISYLVRVRVGARVTVGLGLGLGLGLGVIISYLFRVWQLVVELKINH